MPRSKCDVLEAMPCRLTRDKPGRDAGPTSEGKVDGVFLEHSQSVEFTSRIVEHHVDVRDASYRMPWRTRLLARIQVARHFVADLTILEQLRRDKAIRGGTRVQGCETLFPVVIDVTQ